MQFDADLHISRNRQLRTVHCKSPFTMQSSFCGSRVSGGQAVARCGPSRTTVVVRAVQDLQGKVVSTSMNKGVVVAVERLSPHTTYLKRTRITKKYIAHDEIGCGVGDVVRLEGCRPLSKHKRFTVAQIVRKSDM